MPCWRIVRTRRLPPTETARKGREAGRHTGEDISKRALARERDLYAQRVPVTTPFPESVTRLARLIDFWSHRARSTIRSCVCVFVRIVRRRHLGTIVGIQPRSLLPPHLQNKREDERYTTEKATVNKLIDINLTANDCEA